MKNKKSAASSMILGGSVYLLCCRFWNRTVRASDTDPEGV